MSKKSNQVPFSLRIDAELMEKYRVLSEEKSVSIGSLVNKACQYYLDDLDQTEVTNALFCIASRQEKMTDKQKSLLSNIAKKAEESNNG